MMSGELSDDEDSSIDSVDCSIYDSVPKEAPSKSSKDQSAAELSAALESEKEELAKLIAQMEEENQRIQNELEKTEKSNRDFLHKGSPANLPKAETKQTEETPYKRFMRPSAAQVIGSSEVKKKTPRPKAPQAAPLPADLMSLAQGDEEIAGMIAQLEMEVKSIERSAIQAAKANNVKVRPSQQIYPGMDTSQANVQTPKKSALKKSFSVDSLKAQVASLTTGDERKPPQRRQSMTPGAERKPPPRRNSMTPGRKRKPMLRQNSMVMHRPAKTPDDKVMERMSSSQNHIDFNMSISSDAQLMALIANVQTPKKSALKKSSSVDSLKAQVASLTTGDERNPLQRRQSMTPGAERKPPPRRNSMTPGRKRKPMLRQNSMVMHRPAKTPDDKVMERMSSSQNHIDFNMSISSDAQLMALIESVRGHGDEDLGHPNSSSMGNLPGGSRVAQTRRSSRSPQHSRQSNGALASFLTSAPPPSKPRSASQHSTQFSKASSAASRHHQMRRASASLQSAAAYDYGDKAGDYTEEPDPYSKRSTLSSCRSSRPTTGYHPTMDERGDEIDPLAKRASGNKPYSDRRMESASNQLQQYSVQLNGSSHRSSRSVGLSASSHTSTSRRSQHHSSQSGGLSASSHTPTSRRSQHHSSQSVGLSASSHTPTSRRSQHHSSQSVGLSASSHTPTSRRSKHHSSQSVGLSASSFHTPTSRRSLHRSASQDSVQYSKSLSAASRLSQDQSRVAIGKSNANWLQMNISRRSMSLTEGYLYDPPEDPPDGDEEVESNRAMALSDSRSASSLCQSLGSSDCTSRSTMEISHRNMRVTEGYDPPEDPPDGDGEVESNRAMALSDPRPASSLSQISRSSDCKSRSTGDDSQQKVESPSIMPTPVEKNHMPAVEGNITVLPPSEQTPIRPPPPPEVKQKQDPHKDLPDNSFTRNQDHLATEAMPAVEQQHAVHTEASVPMVEDMIPSMDIKAGAQLVPEQSLAMPALENDHVGDHKEEIASSNPNNHDNDTRGNQRDWLKREISRRTLKSEASTSRLADPPEGSHRRNQPSSEVKSQEFKRLNDLPESIAFCLNEEEAISRVKDPSCFDSDKSHADACTIDSLLSLELFPKTASVGASQAKDVASEAFTEPPVASDDGLDDEQVEAAVLKGTIKAGVIREEPSHGTEKLSAHKGASQVKDPSCFDSDQHHDEESTIVSLDSFELFPMTASVGASQAKAPSRKEEFAQDCSKDDANEAFTEPPVASDDGLDDDQLEKPSGHKGAINGNESSEYCNYLAQEAQKQAEHEAFVEQQRKAVVQKGTMNANRNDDGSYSGKNDQNQMDLEVARMVRIVSQLEPPRMTQSCPPAAKRNPASRASTSRSPVRRIGNSRSSTPSTFIPTSSSSSSDSSSDSDTSSSFYQETSDDDSSVEKKKTIRRREKEGKKEPTPRRGRTVDKKKKQGQRNKSKDRLMAKSSEVRKSNEKKNGKLESEEKNKRVTRWYDVPKVRLRSTSRDRLRTKTSDSKSTSTTKSRKTTLAEDRGNSKEKSDRKSDKKIVFSKKVDKTGSARKELETARTPRKLERDKSARKLEKEMSPKKLEKEKPSRRIKLERKKSSRLSDKAPQKADRDPKRQLNRAKSEDGLQSPRLRSSKSRERSSYKSDDDFKKPSKSKKNKEHEFTVLIETVERPKKSRTQPFNGSDSARDDLDLSLDMDFISHDSWTS